LSEYEEDQDVENEAGEVEIVLEVPVVEGGSYLYVCSECGNTLTEIPYYNRFYCENCGLHY
jgi:protein-arginine kinase activator protein McsA